MNHALALVSKLKNLQELGLPVNHISDLPENIGDVKQIRLLNLRDNNLTDLPDEISGLKNLNTLYLEDNIIVNPVNSLEKIKKINIKYISLDTGLTDMEIQQLKELFPQTDIVQVRSGKDDPMDTAGQDSDTVFTINTARDSHGTFQIRKQELKAYSTAYLNYSEIFDNEQFGIRFDTLLFDERYADTTYCNTWKISDRTRFPGLILNRYYTLPCFKMKYFDFYCSRAQKRFISKNYPELNVFHGFVWKYDGELSRKQLRKYIFSNGFLSPKKWTDIRIYYNEPEKNFIIELKNEHGFRKIPAIPVKPRLTMDIRDLQKVYQQLFERYTKTLDRRKSSFHRSLFRNKNRYEKAVKKSYEETWRSFSRMYMSKKERSMTEEAWLDYYLMIMENEEEALLNSDISLKYIRRLLEIKKYQSIENDFSNFPSDGIMPVKIQFRDKTDSSCLIISELLMIDTQKQQFMTCEGSWGVKTFQIPLEKTEGVLFIVKLRNGNFGILPHNERSKINLESGEEIILPVEIIDKQLGSVRQVVNKLEL